MNEAAPLRRSTRVLFLTKYGRRAASTRFRVLQYLPYFEQCGLDVEVRPLLGDTYLTQKLDEGRSGALEAVKGMIDRLLTLREVRQFALVVVHMEALPYLPAFFERALTRLGVPYVYDFDDASFHQYDQDLRWIVRRVLSGKIPRVIEGAALVTAGNEYLASYARQFNSNVSIVPTVVDVEKFAPAQAPTPRDRVVIGWIGSPSTAAYVVERERVWQAVTGNRRSSLRLVGAGPVSFGTVEVDARPWREDTETAEVRDFDIGIMPLKDDAWSRGKCGFKLIEYLSCGVPVVASPVGVNARIVQDGETGFLCSTDEQWIARLTQLVDDASLRRAMGARGRDAIRQHWSLQRWGPQLAGLLSNAAREAA